MSTLNLKWVHGELLDRLNEVRLAVEAHAAEPGTRDSIERCCDLVAQVHRVLQLVGVHAPVLLVEEMAALSREIASGEVSDGVEAHEALMRSVIDLAGYLDRLRYGHREHPLDLLQMVNDLRSARRKPLISPGALFAPPLWADLPSGPPRPASRRRSLEETIKRLRRMYQYVLLELLRAGGHRERACLQGIDDILERVEVHSSGTPAMRLWWVARAMVQSLAAGELELTVACKCLLGRLDQELRTLLEEGEAALAKRPPAELLRHLLYYAATSGADEGRTGQVKAVFGLRELVPSNSGDTTTTGHGRGAALNAVCVPLNAALSEAEEMLSQAGVHVSDEVWAREVAAKLRQLSVTLGLLGVADLRTRMEEHALDLIAEGQLSPDDRNTLLLRLAEDLIGAKAIVGALNDADFKGIPTATEVAVLRYREARLQGVAQLRNELFHIKERLTAFAANPAEPAPLVQAATALQPCIGVLAVIDDRGPDAELVAWVTDIIEAAPEQHADMGREDLQQVAELITAMELRLDTVADAPPPAGVGKAVARAGRDDSAKAQRAADGAQPSGAAQDVPSDASQPVQADASAAVAVPDSPAAAPIVDEEIDEDLLEIFTDEVAEVIENLQEHVPVWTANLSNRESLMEIRRAYHTLKGSGRVVGATEVGEFSWSIESVLNRVIDGTLGATSEVARLVEDSTRLLPQVLESLRARQGAPTDMEEVRARAWRLVA